MLSSQSTRKVVDPEDDHDRGWHDRFMLVSTHDCFGSPGSYSRENEMIRKNVTFLLKLSLLLSALLEFRTTTVLTLLAEAPDIEEFFGKILSCSPMSERF